MKWDELAPVGSSERIQDLLRASSIEQALDDDGLLLEGAQVPADPLWSNPH